MSIFLLLLTINYFFKRGVICVNHADVRRARNVENQLKIRFVRVAKNLPKIAPAKQNKRRLAGTFEFLFFVYIMTQCLCQ